MSYVLASKTHITFLTYHWVARDKDRRDPFTFACGDTLLAIPQCRDLQATRSCPPCGRKHFYQETWRDVIELYKL